MGVPNDHRGRAIEMLTTCAIAAPRRRLPAMRSGPIAPPRRYQLVLAAVAVLFAAGQSWFVGLRLGYGWDEAVYLSVVNPAAPDAWWGAWRALGTSLLMSPVAAFDAPVEVVRLYAALLSSAGLFLAFRVWLAVRNDASVPLAALLFASTYITAIYGPQVFPNYYLALAAVATVGLFVRALTAASPAASAGLAFAVGLAALVRPSDSLWLLAPLWIVWLLRRPWRPGVAMSLGLGMVGGWLPWIIEANARFGGPLHRWAASREAVGGSLRLDPATLELYGRLSGTSMLECFGACATNPPVDGLRNPAVAAWWLGATLLVAMSLRACPPQDRFALAALPSVVAVVLALPYLLFLQYSSLRFLLPAFALLTLPVAAAIVSVARMTHVPARRSAMLLAAAVVLAHLAAQVNVLRLVAPVQRDQRAAAVLLAAELRARGIGGNCLIVGDAQPQLQYLVRCDWHATDGDPLTAEPTAAARARASGRTVAVILRRPVPPGSYLDSWRRIDIAIARLPGLRLYLPPERPPATRVPGR